MCVCERERARVQECGQSVSMCLCACVSLCIYMSWVEGSVYTCMRVVRASNKVRVCERERERERERDMCTSV